MKRKEIIEALSGWFVTFYIVKTFVFSVLYSKIVNKESLISGIIYWAVMILADIVYILIAIWRKRNSRNLNQS